MDDPQDLTTMPRHHHHHHHHHHRLAFSIIELSVVLIVIAVVAAIAVPTFAAVIDESDFRAHQARDQALARRIGAGIAFNTQPTYAEIVTEALAETDVSTLAPGLSAQGDGWDPTVNYIPTVDPSDPDNEANWVTLAAGDDPSGAPWTADRYQLAWTVDDTALRTATRHDATRVVYCSVLLANGLGICTDGTAGDAPAPAPGFALTVDTERDAALDLSWPTQAPATEYLLQCWTPALDPAGDTPKTVPAAPGGTQTASVTGLENFVEHTCEVDAVVSPAPVTSAPATGTPFTGPTLPDPPGGPPSAPPVGPEPGLPTTAEPPSPAGCTTDPSNPDCLGTSTTLAGLTSFVSTHAGTHQLYTVDTSANRLRVVVDTGSLTAATRTISVLDPTGATVDLSSVTDLAAGRHPSRRHPQGASPYSVIYASTSTGAVWMISPISGSSTWRGYQVASGLGAVSSIAYDNCPTGPATSARAASTMCVHAATAAGIVPVPMTAATAPAVETPLAARGPAATAVASNTADGLAGVGDGAYFTTAGATLVRTNWDGSANALANTGTAMTTGAGVAWMADNFYVADPGSRRLFRVTASGARSVVAGSTTTPFVLDGTGTAAGFANPTRVHWHGSTPDVYVLDGNCVRRVNTTTGEVRTLLCPASTQAVSALLRTDSTAASPVYAASASSSTTAATPASELSADGQYVVFASAQANLTATDASTDWDLFRRRIADGTIELLTDGADGAPSGVDAASGVPVSADGGEVAFTSGGVLYHQVVGGTTTQIAAATWFGLSNNLAAFDVSADGSTVLFRTDKDLLPVDATGSGNALPSVRGNDYDVYSWNTSSGLGFVSSRADGTPANSASGFGCSSARYSPDESRVSMQCSTALVTPDGNGTTTDVFVKDLSTGAVWRGNESAAGTQSTAAASLGGMLDNDSVVFTSTDAGLVAGDTNASGDVFIKTLSTGAIVRATNGGVELTGTLDYVAAGSWGLVVATTATIDPGDTNAVRDLYLYNPATGGWTWLSASPGGGGGWLTSSGTYSDLSVTSTHVAYTVRYQSNGNRRYLVLRER